jgi:hypothetical protein
LQFLKFYHFFLIKVPVFSKFAFFQLGPFLLKIFSLDATFKSVGDINNLYAFKKKVVLVLRIIGGGGGFKKICEIFDIIF